MTSSKVRLVSVAVACAVLASAPAWAQSPSGQPTAQELETARTLYKEGKELRAVGDLNGALEKLRAAHALGNTPVTGIELARTYVMVGKLVEAREVALQVARLGVASDETVKSAEARVEAAKLAEELRPRIPTLSVRIQGMVPNEVPHLVVDGVAVPDAALGEPLAVDPGKHEVVLHVGEGAAAREAKAEAETVEGKPAEVTIQAPPGPQPPPPAPELERDLSYRTPALAQAAFTVTVLGAVWSLIAGGVAGGFAAGLPGNCNLHHQCIQGSPGGGQYQLAHQWATITDVSWAVTGLALAGGVADILVVQAQHRAEREKENGTAPPQSARAGVNVWATLGLGSAGLHGEF